MAHLQVIEAGSSTLQGLGRYGSQRYGIAPGGAMDRLSLAEANALIGQPAGAAAIEIGPLPAQFLAVAGAVRVAAGGALREIMIGDRPLPLGQTGWVPPGAVLTVRGARQGRFTYLAVEGGLQGCGRGHSGPPLETSSPDRVRSWVLAADDQIAVRPADADAAEQRLRLQVRTSAPIRVVLGPQLDYFATEEVRRFTDTPWAVSHAANRMAYTLEGGRIALHKGHNIVSDGTVTGSIQIAGNGQPVVVLCDRGTVGGYPKIATIISSDLGRFSQTPPGGGVRFEPVSVLEAKVVAREYAVALLNVKPRVETLAATELSTPALFDCNLAGEVFDAAAWRTDGGIVAPEAHDCGERVQ
jgi:5-oxoprolinase (ATP-hydrolysing) subunit C